MLNLPLSILAFHTLCDWFLQTNWMALNKSKNWWALSVHSVVATSYCLLWGVEFWFVNLVCHFVTDAVTSRLTTRWWFVGKECTVWCDEVGGDFMDVPRYDGKKRQLFFKTIGADQLIHFITLALTLRFL